jgi:acyl carrier protein phosphodiesterase
LAHIYLSGTDDQLKLGNFYGDFVRSSEMEKFSNRVQQGVLLHREIDEYTDRHPAFLDMVSVLRPYLFRYAPVALDLICDHLLSGKWKDLGSKSLRIFCNDFYSLISHEETIVPKKLFRKIDLMLEHDFLMSTSSEERLFRSLQHMDRRARFDSNFTEALTVMKGNKLLFEDKFEVLIQDLRSFSQTRIDEFSN